MLKLKLENGQVVLSDGKPVYIKDDGTEIAFDAEGTTTTIARLNSEARENRKALETATAKLELFGELDPAAARKALDTVKNLDESKLIQAGKVDEIKNELNRGWQQKFDAVQAENVQLKSDRDRQRLVNQFRDSKFVSEKMAGVTTALAVFGNNFKYEDGKFIGYDANGQKLYSPANPGEFANFDEAVQILVNAHPDKASLLKSDARGGAGTQPGSGGRPAGGNGKTLTRSQWEALDAGAKAKHFQDGGSIMDAPAT